MAWIIKARDERVCKRISGISLLFDVDILFVNKLRMHSSVTNNINNNNNQDENNIKCDN